MVSSLNNGLAGILAGETADEILERAKQVPEAEIAGWEDVDRLDVRPARGIVKVRAQNRWEPRRPSTSLSDAEIESLREAMLEAGLI